MKVDSLAAKLFNAKFTTCNRVKILSKFFCIKRFNIFMQMTTVIKIVGEFYNAE